MLERLSSTSALMLTFVSAVSIGSTRSASASPHVQLDALLAQPVVLAGREETTFLKIGLTGLPVDDAAPRAPVDLAIVIDRSGSMEGDKIQKAKEAALMLVDRLGESDILSVVAYDSVVEVVVPATPLVDRESVKAKIRSIEPRGSTALFAGVSRGVEEVRKFDGGRRVRRVILLSDGQANVGPSSPNELGRLGAATAKEGISITTIGLGLGYNEDLMSQLAVKSDGNHAFAETPAELTKIFDYELKDVLTVVAQEVSIKVALADGVTPVRVLGRDAEIRGREVVLSMNQLYARQEKYVLLEVRLGSDLPAPPRTIGSVDVSFADAITGKTERLSAKPSVAFARSTHEVEAAANAQVMIAASEAIATDNNRRAVALRDQGKLAEARAVLLDNSAYLKKQANKLGSKKLADYGTANESDAANLDEDKWVGRRKVMRKAQHTNDMQQSY